jgi:hypothetical protein
VDPEVSQPYSVAIVLNQDFGSRLKELAGRMHVWACGTEKHRRLAQECWESNPVQSLERGITTFDFVESASAEEIFLRVLPMFDLHHGEHSHDPPWTQLLVYGVSSTPAVREALRHYGQCHFEDTADGFRCSRASRAA